MVKIKNKAVNFYMLAKQVSLSAIAYIFPIFLAYMIPFCADLMTGKESKELFSQFVFNDIAIAALTSILITNILYMSHKEKIALLHQKCSAMAFGLSIICMFFLICLFVIVVADAFEITYEAERKEDILRVVFIIEALSCINSCVINCLCHPEQYLVEVK